MRWFGTIPAVVVTGLLTGGCGASEINQPAASSSVTASRPATSTSTSSASAKPVAHVGATLSLTRGEQVTLTQVIDPAQGTQYESPDPGKRFAAVVFKVTDVSQKAASGDANVDASVIGSDDQTYSPDFDTVTECTDFNYGSFQLGPGESATGCITFQLPTPVRVAKVQWAPGGGFSGEFAEWLVP